MTDQQKKRQPAYADYGTKERARHGEVKPELTGRGYAIRMRAQDSCELDRLLNAGKITPDQWSAGDAFARQLHAAKMMGVSVSKLVRVGGGDHISQRQANALLQVSDTQRWLDVACGEQGRRLTVGVCLDEMRAGSQEDVTLLRRGLSALLDMSDDRRQRLAILDELTV